MPEFTGFVAILFSFNCQRQDYSDLSGDCQASIFLSVNLLEFSLPYPRNSKSVVLNIHNFHIYFLLQFTETQVNHRVRKDRKYRITLCCSLILTFIEFVT